jgi:hypothetical protein
MGTALPRLQVRPSADPNGTHSAMAALAVATATELKRWQPTKLFVQRHEESDASLAASTHVDPCTVRTPARHGVHPKLCTRRAAPGLRAPASG